MCDARSILSISRENAWIFKLGAINSSIYLFSSILFILYTCKVARPGRRDRKDDGPICSKRHLMVRTDRAPSQSKPPGGWLVLCCCCCSRMGSFTEASRFPVWAGAEQEHLGATGVGVLYPASPNGRSLSAMQASHTDPSIDEDSASLQPITTLF